MTKKTEKTMKAAIKVITKSCFVAAAIEGGKMYMRSEKKAFINSNGLRKALAVANIGILAVGMWEALNYSNEIINDFDKETDNIEYDPELDDIQIQE